MGILGFSERVRFCKSELKSLYSCLDVRIILCGVITHSSTLLIVLDSGVWLSLKILPSDSASSLFLSHLLFSLAANAWLQIDVPPYRVLVAWKPSQATFTSSS